MIVVNTETIPGYAITETKGLVQGNTIRAKHVGRDFAAGLKNLVGGELRGYTELLIEARRQALERMLAQAEQLGANAVVNVRFTTSATLRKARRNYTRTVRPSWRRHSSRTSRTSEDAIVVVFWLQILPILFLLVLAFTVGGFVERAHFRRIERGENELAYIQRTDVRTLPAGAEAELCGLVAGEVVIASDYFKTFAATIRQMVGGNLRTYETLMERARREALIRMLTDARRKGANYVANVRFASSNVGSGSNSKRRRLAAMVEMYAYGTAYRIDNNARGGA